MYHFKPQSRASVVLQLLLCFVATLSCLATIDTARATTLTQPIGGCKEYIFVGMRGSGQLSIPGNTSSVNALGPELSQLYTQLLNDPRFKGKITFDAPSDYKALGVTLSSTYLTQVVFGAPSSLLGRLEQLSGSTGCPNSNFILAGYSQGAYAVHKVLYDLQNGIGSAIDSAIASKIVGGIALADPGQASTGILPFLNSYTASKDGVAFQKALLQFGTLDASLRADLRDIMRININGSVLPFITLEQQLYSMLPAKGSSWPVALTPLSGTFFHYEDSGDAVAKTSDWLASPLKLLLRDLTGFLNRCSVAQLPVVCPAAATHLAASATVLAVQGYNAGKVHTGYLNSSFPSQAQLFLDNRVDLFQALHPAPKPTPARAPTPAPTTTLHPTPTPTTTLHPTPAITNSPIPGPTKSSLPVPTRGSMTPTDSNYVLGQTGPAGGTIFYYSSTGFNCGVGDTSTGNPTASLCHYLESAPSTWSSGDEPKSLWTAATYQNSPVPGLVVDSVPNSSSSAIGGGFANSLAIAAQNESSAAALARAYRGGSKSDWYLPDTAELNQLCKYASGQSWVSDATACTGVGSTTPLLGLHASTFYWSSSEYTGDGAWGMLIADGFKVSAGRSSLFYIRPIRAF